MTLPKETSQYLQSVFGVPDTTIQDWYKTVCRAFPYLHKVSTGFLVVAMGGLQSGLEAGLTAEEWIAKNFKNNVHHLEEN